MFAERCADPIRVVIYLPIKVRRTPDNPMTTSFLRHTDNITVLGFADHRIDKLAYGANFYLNHITIVHK